MPVLQQKHMAIMGTLTSQVASLDVKVNKITDKFDKDARLEWKEQEASGIGSVHQARQQPLAPTVDDSLTSERIEFLSEFETEVEPKEKYLWWCGYKDLSWDLGEAWNIPSNVQGWRCGRGALGRNQ